MSLPFRQVHLDFHTSPYIPAVAADFDADSFAKQLADAHVDLVTCFARCHHGYLYYDSATNPERIHPQLDFAQNSFEPHDRLPFSRL